MIESHQIVPAFARWGFVQMGKADTQIFGTCPFCTKPKFYIHRSKALWDCKVCGVSGNYFTFLEKILDKAKKKIGDAEYRKLCVNRGLPRVAFKDVEIGFWKGEYVFPIRGEQGRLSDLRRFKLGGKIFGALGCHVGLWNARELFEAKADVPVYLCEGEWDGMALRWLLGFLKKPGVVVSVPGANTFKLHWVELFRGRDVHACYDNDSAGEMGEQVAYKRLHGIAKSITYLHWKPGLEDGFDVRDWITRNAIDKKKPNSTFAGLHSMFQPKPRREPPDLSLPPLTPVIAQLGGNSATNPADVVTLDELKDTYSKWLYLKDTTAIEVMMAVVMSNFLEGDPLWMFLVAPPGGAKTELINSLSLCPSVYFTSSLTPHALISGADRGGRDPSLVPQLDGLILAIKDFTTVLDLREQDKEEIFGILRDAYDGTCGKVFGNGIRRQYKSKFTIVSGVTEKIYKQGSHQNALGERFLKCCIEGSLDRPHEEDIVQRAISNLTHETSMRLEIAEKAAKFVSYMATQLPKTAKDYPTIPKDIVNQLAALAMFGARMRGVIARDRYRQDMIDSRPSAEIATRLSKQLAKLLMALAFVNRRKIVTAHEYAIARKVMIDTISQRNEDLICRLADRCANPEDSVKTKDLSFATSYTQSTVSRVLSDMHMLGVVNRAGKPNAWEWSVSAYMRNLMLKAGIYNLQQVVEQPKLSAPKPALVKL